MLKIKEKAIVVLLVLILLYTRFINLGWGLPYPMHPDERNMAVAIQQLNCKTDNYGLRITDLKECFNPHFFAYGQFPLYLGYLVALILKIFDGEFGMPIGFSEAVISLRIISALSSILNVFVLANLLKLIFTKVKHKHIIIWVLALTFAPYAIQFSHFGTTESLLMLFYSLIVYLSLNYLGQPHSGKRYIWEIAFICGLAIATKISSLIFVILPFLVFLFSSKKIKENLVNSFLFIALTAFFGVVFSPQSLISWTEFMNSMKYESAVGTGSILVFYTRQFLGSTPVLFQMQKIFPYVFGWSFYALFILGFFLLSWKDKRFNLLRLAFLIYFIPNSFLFAKWTRFMAPVFPVAVIIALIFFEQQILNIKYQISKLHAKNQRLVGAIFGVPMFLAVILCLAPGISYLSIYENQDVRFTASEWIWKNVSDKTTILSETANVVDIPLPSRQSQAKNYQIVSFDFYELDNSPILQGELDRYLKEAGYIFVPSRRIFMNHMNSSYPKLNSYYKNLFSGGLGFSLVKEFSSYPQICLPYVSRCWILKDEQAEETWTVFDHPVIRVYRRN